MTKREQIIGLLERRLAQIDRQIADLQQMMHHADPKLREDLSRELEAIRERRQTVEDHLTRLRLQEAEAWSEEDLESGMFAVLDAIGDKIARLLGRERS